MATCIQSDRLLNERQAAQVLTLQPQTLALWRSCKRYSLAYIRVGRHIRYRQSELERFLESRTVSGGDATE